LAYNIVTAPESGAPLARSFFPQLLSAPQPPAAFDFLPMNSGLPIAPFPTIAVPAFLLHLRNGLFLQRLVAE
jgi:hypothetical protein